MKTTLLLYTLPVLSFLSFPFITIAQQPDLGTAANYVLFTSTGAVSNTGTSQIIGKIGTNTGAVTGFEAPSTLLGSIDSGNAVTAQCAIDLQAAYTQLYNTAATSSSHIPAFGSGETLVAGVYSIAAAGSVAGTLTLDAQGNTNAVFIFKFGGAFTTGASTIINLVNGASACNIFWGAEGEIAMAAYTTMMGTLIANNGAISMGAGGILEGRMLSTTGAASIYAVSASIPICSALPLEIISFTGYCNRNNTELKWETLPGTNNAYFTVEKSGEGLQWQVLKTIPSSVNSSALHIYTITDAGPNKGTIFYRLKQTDIYENFKYGNIIAVKKCVNDAANTFTVYPNPSNGKFQLLCNGNTLLVNAIKIFNTQGQQLFASHGFQSTFDLCNKTPGIYFMHVQQHETTVNLKFVIKN